ncbi:MAG TPA: RNA-binding cell elongation regulator Jag/EloR [Acidimicrobiales bacterium]|nr:RNA-binding cell elongation regulator Jag/EloR [Acidimicrobiales bacterium]
MEWVETTGKSIDEAKEAALDQLGVDASDAEFVVISEPKAGLFGRMRGEARVRARVRPTAPRPKRGRSRRSEGGARRSEARAGGSGSASGAAGGGGGARSGQGQRGGVAVAEGDGEGPESNGTAASVDGAGPGGGRAPGGSTQGGTATRKRRRRGGRGRSRGGGGAPGTATGAGPGSGAGRPAESDRSEGGETRRTSKGTEEEMVEGALSLEEQAESAREFVEGLVREMGLQAEVGVRLVDDETAEVTVAGEELGLLIGPGGATLSALQEVTRTVVQRHTGGHSDRIIVDVAGYRARRAEALARFATKIAEEVLSTGEERALEPMSPPDRKVVHDTVNGIDGVRTRSEGEEPRRFIVICPSGEPTGDDAGD